MEPVRRRLSAESGSFMALVNGIRETVVRKNAQDRALTVLKYILEGPSGECP